MEEYLNAMANDRDTCRTDWGPAEVWTASSNAQAWARGVTRSRSHALTGRVDPQCTCALPVHERHGSAQTTATRLSMDSALDLQCFLSDRPIKDRPTLLKTFLPPKNLAPRHFASKNTIATTEDLLGASGPSVADSYT